MKNIIRKLLPLFLLLISNIVAFTQTSKQTLDFADSLFAVGNYQQATKMYERVLFFTGNQYANRISSQLANCYFQDKKYSQAAKYFEFSFYTAKNDSARFEIQLMKASCYMLLHNFNLALVELYGISDEQKNELNFRRRNMYLAICYWGLGNYRKSEALFLNSIPPENAGAKKKITALFSDKKNFRKPSVFWSGLLSVLVPGTGFLVLGDYRNAANSFVLTNGLLLLGIKVATQYSVLDAFFSVFPWFQRYYQGGYTKTLDLARHKQAEKRNKTFQEILKVIGNQ
jgi:tetratricopeptide (TPR) repeat protein